MADPLLTALWRQLHDLPGPHLVIADENCRDAPWSLLPPGCRVLSNRWDVAEQARAADLDSRFSDFEFSLWEEPPRSIAYRVSKEKPLVHYVINEARRGLPIDGHLLLAGEKSEGIKSYASKGAALFGQDARARKEGKQYFCHLQQRAARMTTALLDDQDYRTIREVACQHGVRIFGKPGLFGWDRIDAGSALLVAQLPELLGQTAFERLLDLGCGSGYLAAQAAPYAREIVATDNNAAALAVAAHTFAANGIEASVVAGDCGDRVEPAFDLILCNPPFHQGFDHSGDLTRRFLHAAAQLLSPGGQALFVVNAFIGLEALAADCFGDCQAVARDRSFKVIRLRRPRPPRR